MRGGGGGRAGKKLSGIQAGGGGRGKLGKGLGAVGIRVGHTLRNLVSLVIMYEVGHR